MCNYLLLWFYGNYRQLGSCRANQRQVMGARFQPYPQSASDSAILEKLLASLYLCEGQSPKMSLFLITCLLLKTISELLEKIKL